MCVYIIMHYVCTKLCTYMDMCVYTNMCINFIHLPCTQPPYAACTAYIRGMHCFLSQPLRKWHTPCKETGYEATYFIGIGCRGAGGGHSHAPTDAWALFLCTVHYFVDAWVHAPTVCLFVFFIASLYTCVCI